MIEYPLRDDPFAYADWIELYTVYNDKELSKSKIISLLRSTGEEPSEILIDSAISELKRREHLYGDSSPFRIDGNIITPLIKWEDFPEYVMCLIFSLQGVIKEKGRNDGTKLFEEISGIAVKNYIGGETLVLGFPSGHTLKQQIENFCIISSEEIGHEQVKSTDKDKGVDIIAWLSHKDNRNNQIIILLQCAAGYNWGMKKNISLRGWRDIIHISADPIAGLVLPIVVSQDEWKKVRDDYNLIFDRIRIIKALKKASNEHQVLQKDIANWCREQLQ